MLQAQTCLLSHAVVCSCHRPAPPTRTATPPVQVFALWKQGQTGMPLVDANMRELSVHGVHVRTGGRQNVASYLILDLGVDWRRGADWFRAPAGRPRRK